MTPSVTPSGAGEVAAPLAVLRRAAVAGTPLAPVHAVLGIRLDAVEPGTCTATATAPPDPGGLHPLLPVLVLADFAVGVAVNATVAAGERIATLTLALQRVAPTAPGTVLVAHGRLDDTVGDALTGSTEIRDGDGRVVARATARNAVLRDDLADAYGDTPEAFDAAAPWPVAELVEIDGEHGELVARPHASTANSADAVQGGVLAAVGARALSAALGRVPDELSATFLRATPADGAPIRARATVEHAGRRLRTGRATVSRTRQRTLVAVSGLSYADPD